MTREAPVGKLSSIEEGNARIVPRSEHSISRRNIADEALKVLYRLRALRFKAYLVGGGVRDLYLGKKPKDFDIATDAKPSRLKKIFRNCRIIGRRFRIAHVYFPGDKIIEVATFRRGEVRTIEKENGVILLDNEYGTPEEDAKRRDLTINGLFYDVGSFSIIDYVGGVSDLDSRIIRTIKEPDVSFKEDPVRMIRALRHSSRTGFSIDPATDASLRSNRLELQKANSSRLMEEAFRDLRSGAAKTFFMGAAACGLLETILPTLSRQLDEHGADHPLIARLETLDAWTRAGRELSNPILISILLHTVLLPNIENWHGDASNPRGVWDILQRGVRDASTFLRISRRDTERVLQVILAYHRLRDFSRQGDLGPTYRKKTYLRAALDFFELSEAAVGRDSAIVDEWRERYAKDLPATEETAAQWRARRRRRRRPLKRSSGPKKTAAKETPADPAKTRRRRRRRRPKKSTG